MKLRLAVDFADIVMRAAHSNREIDPDAKAAHLQRRHPEADVSHDEIVEVLVAEKTAMILERVPRQFDMAPASRLYGGNNPAS